MGLNTRKNQQSIIDFKAKQTQKGATQGQGEQKHSQIDILDTIDDGKKITITKRAPRIELSYSSSEVLSPIEEVHVQKTPVKTPVVAPASSKKKP